MKKRASIVVAILLLAVGFAAVSTTLIINGSAKIGENTDDFSVIFTAATLDGTDVYANVIDDTKKIITFETSDLKTLNQTSTLSYEVTNNSANYDAEVQVNCKVKDNTESKYTSIKNELEGNVTKVLAKETLNGTLTVILNKTAIEEVKEEYVCELIFNAIERDTLGKEIPAFQKDSWSTIAANIKNGNTSLYNVGDTKIITIASHTNDCSAYDANSKVCVSSVEPEKEALIRISNMSECTNGETSETACGFVIEFVDIIEEHHFNKTDYSTAQYQYGTNVGGWRDSELRTYLNDTFYKSLPSDLQSVIATTKVVSGHGSTTGETNTESEDKIYLFSTHEIWEDGTDRPISLYDTAFKETKQLDYYKNKGVTTDSYEAAIKRLIEGDKFSWWLRSASLEFPHAFFHVRNGDSWGVNGSIKTDGVSPAFRIA